MTLFRVQCMVGGQFTLFLLVFYFPYYEAHKPMDTKEGREKTEGLTVLQTCWNMIPIQRHSIFSEVPQLFKMLVHILIKFLTLWQFNKQEEHQLLNIQFVFFSLNTFFPPGLHISLRFLLYHVMQIFLLSMQSLQKTYNLI